MSQLRFRPTLRLALLTLGLAVVGGIVPASQGAVNGFVNFQLAGVPLAPVGVTCPGASNCYNFAAEPQIRADKLGRFFGASENGLSGGSDAWRSTDGGRHYTQLTSPDGAGLPATASGGDVDIAIAPDLNATDHNYNVYVSSLNLASVYVATSRNGGATWSVQNPVAADQSGADDREWLAADESAKVCLSYHNGPQGIAVDCSYDAGKTFTQTTTAIDTGHAYQISNNLIGNLAIDHSERARRDGTVYQIYSSITDATEAACLNAGTCGYHAVFMAVSTDGGRTFTDHLVHNSSDATVTYGHQFPNVSVDAAGNVYAVYSDAHNLYYSYSTDRGRTWSSPRRINTGPSNTAIMPWSAAGADGKIDVVWYGSSYYDGVNPPDNYPNTASWKVYFAQNLSAHTAGSTFSQLAATYVIHKGGVCLSGIACTGNRDLYDDFGVDANPLTGLASIIYSDDQWSQSPAQPGCTQTTTNTSKCNHTSIATQTTGPGIY